MSYMSYSELEPDADFIPAKAPAPASKPGTFAKLKSVFTSKSRKTEAIPISARAAEINVPASPAAASATPWFQHMTTEAALEEGMKAELIRQRLTDVWLPDASRPTPVAQLVALAAHACKEISASSVSKSASQGEQPVDSVFKDYLSSSQARLVHTCLQITEIVFVSYLADVAW